MFLEWFSSRNKKPNASRKCPEDLLSVSYPTAVVDYWLAAFVLEARRKDGEFYPGNTLKNLLAAIFEGKFGSTQCGQFY